MEIEVKDERVVEETNNKTGDIYRQQWAWFRVDGIDKPFKLGLGNRAPFKPGTYELAPDSFQVNRFDKLELRYPNLVPVSSASSKKVA